MTFDDWYDAQYDGDWWANSHAELGEVWDALREKFSAEEVASAFDIIKTEIDHQYGM